MSTDALTLLAPLTGWVVPLSEVPDPVFAGGMMGEGVAIEPADGRVYAPCAGTISQLAKTGHALTLSSDAGADILIHVGIDTVLLNGAGFTARVREGQRVAAGETLIEFDADRVAQGAKSLQTVVLVVNGDAFVPASLGLGRVEGGETVLMSVSPCGQASDEATLSASGEVLFAQATVRHGGGLHARPSALVQAAAKPFAARVEVRFGGRSAKAASVVGLMRLGTDEGDTVEVSAQGPDAAAALAAVVAAIETVSEAAHAPAAVPVPLPSAQQGPRFAGVCAAPGLAVGTLVRLDHGLPELAETPAGADAEFTRLASALASVREQIDAMVHGARAKALTQQADIYSAHLALLDDPELAATAENSVANGMAAGAAFRQAVQVQTDELRALDNPLLRERVSDLNDIARQVLTQLAGGKLPEPELDEQSILLADDLAPSELTRLPRERVAGFVTAQGGATSHVAIIARAMGIPALVAAGDGVLSLPAGREVVLDAAAGLLDAEPEAATLSEARQRLALLREQSARRFAAAHDPALSRDGVRVEVAANIGSLADAEEAVRCGADGVGLLRTEFLFLERDSLPNAAEQRDSYQAIVDALAGKTAIIRTLDVGGDKSLPYLPLPPEPNPALGLRGIRSGFARPEVLEAQLEGLLSVKPLARCRILLPMITDVAELIAVRALIDQIAAQLGVTERPEVGVMIEVPSAAVLADQLAEHADFLSIGTNDLTQYALAMDRCHPGLAAQIDGLHPALLRLVKLTVDGAAKHGRWVGVCGALASEPAAVPVLVGLGVAELSVGAALVPQIKAQVRELSVDQCRQEARAMLGLPSAQAVRERVAAVWPQP
ncbi:phosphoenolpyruvate--protein phosphotransferase [Crenobacter sp. SG2303]|uniref:phosphoenolpyruvate--protein phosphotransferase n=1 Tax=Crenobacter oryzisoli TaxID=3056844 RepID=A0ABT7XLQ2_9NEIS|nr:phosphoenolpyruvate--protein phosphotransferase [Crenobacter sp. SG2303]MDN0074714.1 phosphoenolpyruvate--protein phosphotransferase [Crenobacter sp. SG2303]